MANAVDQMYIMYKGQQINNRETITVENQADIDSMVLYSCGTIDPDQNFTWQKDQGNTYVTVDGKIPYSEFQRIMDETPNTRAVILTQRAQIAAQYRDQFENSYTPIAIQLKMPNPNYVPLTMNISISQANFVYGTSGQPDPQVTGAPQGATTRIDYKFPSGMWSNMVPTEVGSYRVKATVSADGYETTTCETTFSITAPQPIEPPSGDVVDVADGNSDFIIKSKIYAGNAEKGSTRLYLRYPNDVLENLPIVRHYDDDIDLTIQATVNEVQNVDVETLIEFKCPFCIDKYIIHDNRIICFTSSADQNASAIEKLERSPFALCNVKQSDLQTIRTAMPNNTCVRRMPIIDRRPIWDWDKMSSFQDAQLRAIFDGSEPLRGIKSADGWYWDDEKNSFVCKPNSSNYYEILGPYNYDCYIHRVTLSSIGSDNDIIGFTIAYGVDDNNVQHSIGVYCGKGDPYVKVRKDDGTGYESIRCSGAVIAVDIEQGMTAGGVGWNLTDAPSLGREGVKVLDGVKLDPSTTYWNTITGITVLVSRVNERIRVWVAYNNETAWSDGRQPDIATEPPTFDIDLSTYDDPAIRYFIDKKLPYAYGACSQPYSFYKGVVVASIDLDKLEYDDVVTGYNIVNNYGTDFIIDRSSEVVNIDTNNIEDDAVTLAKDGTISTTGEARRMLIETPYRTVANYYYPGSKIYYETVKE